MADKSREVDAILSGGGASAASADTSATAYKFGARADTTLDDRNKVGGVALAGGPLLLL